MSIYSKNLVKDIGQSLKSVVGGGLKTYTELLELTTDTATRKMEEKANEMSADVIVGISYCIWYSSKICLKVVVSYNE